MLLIGGIKFPMQFNQSEALPKSVVTPHQYGICSLLSQTSFGGETSGSVAKCRLFSQATTTKIIKHKDSVYIEEGKGKAVVFLQDFQVP